MMNSTSKDPAGPYLRIVEQPMDRFRFRYRSEMTATHGCLNGATCSLNNRRLNQTYPTVELLNYFGRAIIRCSINQYDTINKCPAINNPHAHRLIQRKGRIDIDDPHEINVPYTHNGTYIGRFENMGIIHTAKKYLIPELIRKKVMWKMEEILRIEGHNRTLTIKEDLEIKNMAQDESKTINMNTVCLRFDAFLESEANGVKYPICPPIFSQPINNLKSALTGELKIVRMDHCTSPACGGREIFLLVERVTKKNIRVRFYELDDDDMEIWESYGKFSDLDVHHQYAIVLRTPPYKNSRIVRPTEVFIELERPSDNCRSEPKQFVYTPTSLIEHNDTNKRSRTEEIFYENPLLTPPLSNYSTQLENATFYTNVNRKDNDVVTNEELEAALNYIDRHEFEQFFRTIEENHQHNLTFDNIDLKSKNLTENRRLLKRTIEELCDFIETNHSKEKLGKMLNFYLNTPFKTNALHLVFMEKCGKMIQFLLDLLRYTDNSNLLQIRNEEHQTPLHVAMLYGCDLIHIANLLKLEPALICIVDLNGNSALHYAILYKNQQNYLNSILTSLQVNKSVLNAMNNDGDSALNLAIDSDDVDAIKVLCEKSELDLNVQHRKNGFVPLRFAIERESVEIVEILLKDLRLVQDIEDFNGVTPIEAFFTDYTKSNDINSVLYKLLNKANIKF